MLRLGGGYVCYLACCERVRVFGRDGMGVCIKRCTVLAGCVVALYSTFWVCKRWDTCTLEIDLQHTDGGMSLTF